MELILLLIGLAAGLALGFLIAQYKLSQKKNELVTKNQILEEKNNEFIRTIKNQDQKLIDREKEVVDLRVKISAKEVEFKNIEEKLKEQKKQLEEIQEKFATEFKNLANEILEDKSKKFTEQNKLNITEILNPLKEKIKDFEQKVEKAYKEESTERITLKAEIKNLIEMNNKISAEANNLASALHGDNKMQGNWGEVVLERILERSGLIKGQEYKTQVSVLNDEGSRLQPDVIIYLPDNKHVIIDSKVSLNAYSEYISATDETEKSRLIKLHIDSIKAHIRNLSDKNYIAAAEITSPEFVLMFVPIESSFSIAIRTDIELFNHAWDRKVVIVCPSTLLATLRTISSIWKQERQTRNALEIAEQGGKLYDKFCGLINDLIDVGNKMKTAESSYQEAMKKLSTGNGNIVKSMDNLKKLGAKATKNLPQQLVERANEEEDNDLLF